MQASQHPALSAQPTKLLKALLPALAVAMTVLAAAPAHATDGGGLTRAEVQEALKTWKAAGLVSTQAEVGDTPDVLQRREEFYALQTEVIQAESLVAARATEEAQALAQLQAQHANPAMLEPSADGMLVTAPNGSTMMIVEVDD